VATHNISPAGSIPDRLRQWWESRSFGTGWRSRLRGRSEETTAPGSDRTEAQPKLNRFQRVEVYLSTGLRLGIPNVARALLHRTFKRARIYQWLLPSREGRPLEIRIDLADGVARSAVPWGDRSVLTEADELLRGRASYFSVHARDIGNPPDWFFNPFQNNRHPQPTIHWSKIKEFSADAGDIKIIWEMSRFTWAAVFARAWRISGDPRYLSALQHWIEDWWESNPPNLGPNWMCGQEASIRLMNLLLALRIVGLGETTGTGLLTFVESHCQRVDLTTFYAIAQDNNHATTEAAGLFVGGTWLARRGERGAQSRGRRWAAKGRELLESRVSRLILPDGSFSQHSLTYHRMMLDTLSIAETWRQHLGDVPFSSDFYSRAAAAARWLGTIIDPGSGDGPNLGANDGTRTYCLDASTYRDFRPCLQLASLLFLSRPALEPGPWDESAAWLGISNRDFVRPWVKDLCSAFFPDGGYGIMRNRSGAFALLRAPTGRFRPVHADALHLDLWWNGKNLFRDGGTYSYAGGTAAESLSSVVGHNAHEFDGRDQMLRISRFLYGGWVQVDGESAIKIIENCQSWTGSYTDVWGARHKRTVNLRADALSILDEVQGFKQKAVSRLRLAPGKWTQDKTGCVSPMGRIRVESNVPIRRMSLENGWESRHYLEKTSVPVLEVEIDQSPALLTTTFTLH